MTKDNLGQQYYYYPDDSISRVNTIGGETTYRYDSEGHLAFENGPNGAQVFLYDQYGQILSNNNLTSGYLVQSATIDGEKIGSWQPNQFFWAGTDWLGTKRYESAGQGDISSQAVPISPASYTSLPFGDALSSIGNDPTHFTGKERDSESGLDYFGARYMSSSMGRFMSPDPSGLSYADLANPQSFNLYSYVRNNPLTNVDPTGLDCVHINNDTGAYEGFESGDCNNSTEALANTGHYIDGTVNQISFNGQNQVTGYDASTSSGMFDSYAGSLNPGATAANLNPYTNALSAPGQSVSVNANSQVPSTLIPIGPLQVPNPNITHYMQAYVPSPRIHLTQGQVAQYCAVATMLQGGMNVPAGGAAAGDPSVDPSEGSVEMPRRAAYEQTNQVPGQRMQGGRFEPTTTVGPGAAAGAAAGAFGTFAQCMGAANSVR